MDLYRIAFACLAVALPLSAQAKWYAGPALMIGLTDTSNEEEIATGAATNIRNRTDSGGATLGASGILGYDMSGHDIPISVELSGNWRARHDQFLLYDVGGTDFGLKSDVQTFDFMVSALYDIPLGTKIQPFIGGGVGVTYAELSNTFLDAGTTSLADTDTTNFTWQLQGGIKYPLDDRMKLRVDYRYVDAGEIETAASPAGERFSSDLASHDMRVGVTWDF